MDQQTFPRSGTPLEKLMRTVVLFLSVLVSSPFVAAKEPTAPTPVERGRYLVSISGCNDCHTAGYIARSGNVPENEWLTGDSLSWSGPWGTTYAPNLRLRLADMDLATWTTFARSAVLRPPMPYWSINRMSEEDLEAIWAFTRSLGKAGEPAPAALPPGVEAPLPAFTLHLPPVPANASR